MSKMQSHDSFFKFAMSHIDVAEDFFCANLPKHLLNKLNLKSLKLTSGSFVDKTLNNRITDLLYQINLQEEKEPCLLYLLAEHQSSPDQMMPFRIRQYTDKILAQYLHKTRGTTKYLPLVYPMVIYHGSQSPYPCSTEFSELFKDKVLAQHIHTQTFQLIDLTALSDDGLMKHKLSGLMCVLQKHAMLRDWLPVIQYLSSKEAFEIFRQNRYGDLLTGIVNYMSVTAEGDGQQLYDQIIDALPSQTQKEPLMTIAEHFRQKGIQQGVQQGMQQGMQKNARLIAKNLLKEGASPELIKKVTGLDTKELIEA